MLVAVATLLACASYSADKPKAKAAANVPPPGTLITSADGVRFVGNQLDALPTSYERYLINGLRETFGLNGVPIRISKKGGKNPFHDPGKRKIR